MYFLWIQCSREVLHLELEYTMDLKFSSWNDAAKIKCDQMHFMNQNLGNFRPLNRNEKTAAVSVMLLYSNWIHFNELGLCKVLPSLIYFPTVMPHSHFFSVQNYLVSGRLLLPLVFITKNNLFQKGFKNISYIFGKPQKKSSFFSGPTTEAFTPPPSA